MQADLQVGAPGSFIVMVDGDVVAQKKILGFPSEDEIVAAVRERIGKPA